MKNMIQTYSNEGHLFFKVNSNRIENILGDRLIINPKNTKEASIYMLKNGIKSITINPAYYKVENLDFLNDFLFIEGIFVLQNELDLSKLNQLNNLRALSLNKVNVKIDFNNFPNLEVLGITYSKHTINISNCKKIFWMWLENYRERNIEELGKLNNLQYLTLTTTSIINFEGIEKMDNLVSLKIDSASKLETLEGLSESNISLKEIDIYNAKNLHDYAALGNAKSLEKICFSKAGETDDISFLYPLKNLKNVIIGMKVIDGNIKYLKEIPNSRFLDFPHYNLKMKDLKK